MQRTFNIKQILLTALWLAISVGVIVLLAAAVRNKDARTCKAIKIDIKEVSTNFFVDDNDVRKVIADAMNGKPEGMPIGRFNLRKIETELEKSTWIKQAELFFDNNENLVVTIYEREPIARVFNLSGNSFYIDTAIKVLPLSEKFSARLPVFTNFPSLNMVLSGKDSILLHSIKTLSLAILKDSFRMAMIEQVVITPQNTFEMVPKIGDQTIVFGDATDIDAKFDKLKIFYKEIIANVGWGKYSVINLQYKGQVVAKIRGAEDKETDSLQTLQMMDLMAMNAERQSADSVHTMAQGQERGSADSTMILQSIQREDDGENGMIKDDAVPEKKETPAIIIDKAKVKVTDKKAATTSTVIKKAVPVKAVVKVEPKTKEKVKVAPKKVMPKAAPVKAKATLPKPTEKQKAANKNDY